MAASGIPYDEDNVFKKIIAGTIPSYKIFETEHALAFLDAFPMAKGHSLLIPKATGYASVIDMPPDVAAEVLKEPEARKAVKDATGCDGVNIVQNNGAAAGQVVFHVHFHVLPRWDGDGLVKLGKSGDMITRASRRTPERDGRAAEAIVRERLDDVTPVAPRDRLSDRLLPVARESVRQPSRSQGSVHVDESYDTPPPRAKRRRRTPQSPRPPPPRARPPTLAPPHLAYALYARSHAARSSPNSFAPAAPRPFPTVFFARRPPSTRRFETPRSPYRHPRVVLDRLFDFFVRVPALAARERSNASARYRPVIPTAASLARIRVQSNAMPAARIDSRPPAARLPRASAVDTHASSTARARDGALEPLSRKSASASRVRAASASPRARGGRRHSNRLCGKSNRFNTRGSSVNVSRVFSALSRRFDMASGVAVPSNASSSRRKFAMASVRVSASRSAAARNEDRARSSVSTSPESSCERMRDAAPGVGASFAAAFTARRRALRRWETVRRRCAMPRER